MPEITQQQLSELQQDEEYMRKANLPQSDIDSYRQERLANWGVALPTMGTTGQEALKGSKLAASVIIPTVGAGIGGAAVPATIERYAPEVASAIPHAFQTGLGVGIGTAAGNLIVDPTHPKEAIKQGYTAGIFGGSAEGLFNLLTRGLASMGGVQQPAASEMLRRGTAGRARTVFSKPATTEEANLGSKINEMLNPKNTGITPGRLSTESTLSAMPESSVSISGTLNSLNEAIEKLSEGGIGSGARASLTRLKGIRSDLMTKYIDEALPTDIKGGLMGQQVVGRTSGRPPRQFIDPYEADYINQQIQDAVGNAYGKAGGKESMRTLKGIGAAHTESFRAQTGTAGSAATTQKRLEAIESMRKQISTTTPESFVRGVGDAIMTSGESGDQSALIALREFDKSGRLEKQIRELASRREWTGSQSRIAHNIKWEFVRRAPRFLAKLSGIAARPIGISTGVASAAFQRAMDYP